jgi:hypothetical protein
LFDKGQSGRADPNPRLTTAILMLPQYYPFFGGHSKHYFKAAGTGANPRGLSVPPQLTDAVFSAASFCD